LKISVITAVRNSVATIHGCIESVIGQTHPVEYIVVDGKSTDGTTDILNNYKSSFAKFISEPDYGIYDALNKGIQLATGDFIGMLHADDIYADEHVIENVVDALSQNNTESCYGDLVYVDRKDTDKVIRYWRAGDYHKKSFKRGWMPPHPTFFVKKSIYERYGMLDLDFPLAADYELMLRFLYKHEISTTYIPKVLVKMRTGGISNPGFYTLKAIIENQKAWKVNGLTPNPVTFMLKPLSKLLQYFKKDYIYQL
jgi:glycosyltransferase involved in cell wall biosynthesis